MRRALIFVLLLVWLAVVVTFYFIAHKPADTQQLTALAAWVPGLILSGVLTISAAALGYRFLREWGTPDQRLTLSVVLGLGIFSAAILLLGLVGIVRSEVAWLLVIGGFIIGWRSLKPLAVDLRTTIGELRPRGWFAWMCATYCGVVLAGALLQALAPVTAWDGLAYHLNGPELYQQLGRIAHPVDNPYLGFPQFGEMLFLQLQLMGGQTPSVLHWLFALLTALLVAGEARRLWNEPIGWAAAAIYLSAETVILEAGRPYIDLILAFTVLAAYVCLQAWRDDRTWRSLVLAAAFTGFAMASKYSAAPIAVAFAMLIFWRGTGARIQSLLVFGLVAALVALPWYLKSWVLLGNPFYPFVFDGLYWDPLRSELFNRFGSGLLTTAPWQLLTAPWDMTIWGVEGKIGYAATIGPLFLVLIPITLLGWRYTPIAARRALADAVIICAVVAAGWWIGLALSEVFLQSRLLIPLFPLLALIGVGGFIVLGQFDRPTLSLRRIGMVLVSISLIATATKTVLDFASAEALMVLVGRQSKDAYLTSHLGWYYVAMQDLSKLSTAARVLFLWEPRSLYCQTGCWPDAALDRWWHARRTLGAPDQIAAQWRRDGVAYVLFHRDGYQAAINLNILSPTTADQQALQDLIANHLQLVRSFGAQYELYRWK